MNQVNLESLLSTLGWWTGLFTLFVVIGVAGEFVMHVWESRVSSRLITLQKAREQQLQATIATANQAAAEANQRAKQLEKQTEELKSQNLELARKIAPRFLTTREKETILKAIQPFSGHFIILTRLGDGEAGPYGDSIIAIFQKAGWAIQLNQVGFYSPPSYGIICRVSPHPDDGAKAVIEAFKNANLSLTLQEVRTAKDNSWIDVLVGLKPVN